MKLKTYIVEDEIKALALLKNYVQQIDFLDLVGTARNPMTAFHYLQEHEVEVLFLDINMPILSGIELYKSLRHPPTVIFTTAYSEYAVEGFNLEAVDYLVKPISFARFLQASERLLKRQQISPAMSSELAYLSDIVYVKSGGVRHKIFWREVLFLEKDENYVIYHTPEKRILSRQTLTNLEAIFPTYICRIHKSYAVSLLHTKQVEREFLQIGERILPIGRRYREGLMGRLEGLR